MVTQCQRPKDKNVLPQWKEEQRAFKAELTSLCKGLKAVESIQSISNGQKPGMAVALKLEKNLVTDAIKKIGRLGGTSSV